MGRKNNKGGGRGRGGKQTPPPPAWSCDDVQSIEDLDDAAITQLFKLGTAACLNSM